MERITISLDADLAAEFDRLIGERGYQNRSEAVRDLLRAHLEQARRQRGEADALRGQPVLCLQPPRTRPGRAPDGLAARPARPHRGHLHAHLDHENCLESVVLRGPTAAVRGFADALIAERGVRHGQLNLIDVEIDSGRGSRPRLSARRQRPRPCASEAENLIARRGGSQITSSLPRATSTPAPPGWNGISARRSPPAASTRAWAPTIAC
jgi:CopG family nickel-responsive transcriptional regulator